MNSKLSSSLFYHQLLANFFLTLIISSSYLKFAPDNNLVSEWIFCRLAFISNFGLIYILLGGGLFLLFKIIPYKIFPYIISISIFSLSNIILLIDTIIFRLYRFHINSLVWNILISEGSSDSIVLGQSTLISFMTYVIFIILFQIGIFLFDIKIASKNRFKLESIFPLKYFFIILFVVNLLDKFTYAYADLTNKTHITRYAKLFPLYQPLTIKKVAKKWGYNINQEMNFNINKPSGVINYPLKKLEFINTKNKPNIIIIAIDSWRYDMVKEEISPNIYSFSKNSWVYNNHYSGGNSTRFGLFSIFYGIYGSYWHTILSERVEPVFMKALRTLNYNIGIWSSTELSWPEFRKTAFIGVPDKIYDKIPGIGAKERDRKQPKLFSAWLDSIPKDRPFFSFLLLDAPHEPYSYPNEFKKFKPTAENINYMDLNKNSDLIPFINHYKNAVFYDDYVIGELINNLKKNNLLDNTIIMITGDHGAEFYEHGFWGHNSAFTKEQIKVPFILYMPNKKPKTIDLTTSHFDIVPTIFEILGCSSPKEDYSFGESLLSSNLASRSFIVSSGWNESAIINDNATLVFSTESYNMNTFELRDKNYEMKNSEEYNKYFKIEDINQVIINMGKFLK